MGARAAVWPLQSWGLHFGEREKKREEERVNKCSQKRGGWSRKRRKRERERERIHASIA